MQIQHVYKKLNPNEGLLYAWFSSMHTRVDIILRGEKAENQLTSIVAEINKELLRLERIGSYYHPESELYQLNQRAYISPVTISSELYNMLEMCLGYNRDTFGCFDISVQSDGYHQGTISAICLAAETSSIRYQEEGIRIDLSGFLKGYALEQIRAILKEHHITDALINMGNSSILALGNHPNGEGWKVSLNPSSSAVANPMLPVHLFDECLTTSGNENPQRKHIISPFSGEFVEGMARLAVVTNDGVSGEVLSTGLFVATPSQRQKIIDKFKIKTLLID